MSKQTLTKIDNRFLKLSDDLTKSEWFSIGEKLWTIQQNIPFLMGDWLLKGEQLEYTTEELYNKMEEEWGLKRKTLSDYKSIAKAVPYRLTELSFSHHSAVMSLSLQEQEDFLEEAKEKKWNIQQLQDAVREFKSRRLIDNKPPESIEEKEGQIAEAAKENQDAQEHSDKLSEFWDEYDFVIDTQGVENVLNDMINQLPTQLMKEDFILDLTAYLEGKLRAYQK